MTRYLLRWSVRDGVAFLYRATEIGPATDDGDDSIPLEHLDHIDDILVEITQKLDEPLHLSVVVAASVDDAWYQVGKSEAPIDSSSARTE